ncbi:MAG TPA: hypothetical protein VFV87_11440, partial [Pirellulaceae bacterium]|nr:hypothetical protein [Pirellulaceae bacterium]
MSRINIWTAAVAVLIVVPFVAGPALGQETLEQYLERQSRERQAAALRQERWAEARGREFAAWRAAKAVAEDPLLELPGADLPPGKYSIRLPFGVTRRVVVDEPATVPAEVTLSEQDYANIYSYAHRLNRQLADIQLELSRLQEDDLTGEATRVHDESLNFTAAVTTRQPQTDLQRHFADFDRMWQPLAYHLATRENLGVFVRRAAGDVEALATALNQLLTATAVMATYDRPVVASLTDELVRATANLVEDLQITRLQSVHRDRLEALALRAQRQAADLDATVKTNA